MSLDDVKALAAQQRGPVAQALRWCIQEIERLEEEKDAESWVACEHGDDQQ
jgi:uncharacterized protein (UPF0335 family)